MRRRIMLLVIGMTTLVVLALAVPLAVLIRSAVVQRAEHSTTDQATNAAIYLESNAPTKAQLARYVASLSSSTGRPTWVRAPDGTVVGTIPAVLRTQQSAPVPVRDQPTPEAGASSAANGTGGVVSPAGPGPPGPHAELHVVPSGEVAVASATSGNGRYLVQVFVSETALHAGQTRWWLLLGLGSLGLLLIGAGAAELLTRRLVRPLLRTAHTARQLALGDPSARAPVDGPREVGEVGMALNRLADRIDELIAEERETAADLSHRLRTPLTVLRLDAEALHDRADAERIGAQVNSLERMLTVIIRAARRPEREGRLPSCDATAVVGDRVGFWSALTEDQARAATVELPDGPVPVRAAAEDLAAAVDALLENVIAHTPEGVAFAVRLTTLPDGARLEISDEGPGWAGVQPARGYSDRGSSGLGLDIARRCAEAGGGSMTLGQSPSGGTAITVVLRAP